jgi:multidrug resistance protein, MATE family
MTDTLEKPLIRAAVAPAARPSALDAWLEEARQLLRLATPLIFTQLGQMAVLTSDVIMLGRVGKGALAAAAVGNAVYYFAWLIGGGPVSAISPMIAHIVGARPRDRAGVRACVRMGLWAVALLSAPLVGLLMFTRPILVALRQPPDIAADAGLYIGILCFGLPFSLGFQVLRNFATALGHPRASVWVTAMTVVFNVLGGYTLIFGHFGAPRLGLRGCAIASVSAMAFSFLAMIVVIRLTPGLAPYRIFRRFSRSAWDKLREVFVLGMPIGVTMMFEAMLFNCMTLLMGTFGAAPLAAHQIAMNVPSITFMVPLGVAMAATIRVGRAAGAGDEAGVRRAGYSAMAMAVVFMGLCGVILALFPDAIARLYFNARAAGAAEVIGLAVVYLRVAAAFQIFDALQVVGALSLRGLKDAKVPLVLAGVSYWLVGAPICFGLGVGLRMQGLGVWIGLATALAAAAAAMTARFYWLSRPAPEPLGSDGFI